ncbi:MAG TPA: NrfD/PsrC family molybdoenzyme membrane anchor subunit [Candidatus Binataceae bacterium]|nr:NrfD/PsrC family molybdoenzyme membrane anchor subunit [Candidatus Binataceae bacterium]
MRYGFVIDQDRCIGCHACTVACKEEHNVPIGVFRTWVKYIEKGEFPDTSRHFGVMRCNHCDSAPCVEICPTTSLYRRADGIIDFDSDRCIGCKSCMQACPYDALYIDPNSHTAAKCNYCAHRVEQNLEPACVIVCPTQAIISGDLDDSQSLIATIVATQKVVARKPHKGTEPKLFYKGIDGDLLQPTMPSQSASHFWADRKDAAEFRALETGYRAAAAAASPGASRVVYDVAHPAPWGWRIGAYLLTKSIAAGALLVAALMLTLGYRTDLLMLGFAAPIAAMAFIGVTVILLIADLKRPDRFYFLLTKPNPRSWVVIGAWILMAYGAAAFLWFATAWFAGLPPPLLVWIAALLAIGAACYTGFLFAQAKGRDLWQSPLYTWHLLMQAAIAGAATLIIIGAFTEVSRETALGLGNTLTVSLVLSLAMIMAEVYLAPPGREVELAVEQLTAGALSTRFWGGAIGLGIAAPIILVAIADRGESATALQVIAAALALGGVWMFEELWVRAGQSVPLS